MLITGNYQILGDLHYFIPNPLPPSNPSLNLTAEIMTLYGMAFLFIFSISALAFRKKSIFRVNEAVSKEV